MSKIKPIIKINNNNLSISNWIIEKFPENYKEINYLEPFVGNGSVLLNKEASLEEVVNDLDLKIINIWRSIRDESKLIKNKLSKINYSEKNFNLIKNKKDEKDYLKQSMIELCLKKMSKLGQKEHYDQLDRKKANSIWKEMLENIPIIAERVQNVYFLNKSPIEIIKSFDSQNTFCFCSPPSLNEKNGLLKTEDHIDLGDALNSYRGKVLIYAENTSIYRRMFNSWKSIKRKTASGPTKDCIWVNF
jgi:DNA adenine methylase